MRKALVFLALASALGAAEQYRLDIDDDTQELIEVGRVEHNRIVCEALGQPATCAVATPSPACGQFGAPDPVRACVTFAATTAGRQAYTAALLGDRALPLIAGRRRERDRAEATRLECEAWANATRQERAAICTAKGLPTTCDLSCEPAALAAGATARATSGSPATARR